MMRYERFITCCLLLLVPTLTTAKIVFKSQRDGANNLYVMDDDGSNVQRITFTPFPFSDSGPRYSPDGKHIAFWRSVIVDPEKKGQQTDMFIIDRDGSNEQRLTEDAALDGNHSWAPDGRHLAFTSNRSGNAEIHVIDIVTREIRQLTRNIGLREWAAGPDWSPDGKYIAYRQAKPPRGLTTIYVMNADGKRAQPLVRADNWYRGSPRWSPDSKSVMYVEALYEPGQGFKLLTNNLVIQKHGTKARRILETPKDWLIHSACWMDNGKQVLIGAEPLDAPNRQIDIYRYNLANDNITNLTNHPQDDYSPDWISDKVLSVTPLDKKKVRWGNLKR